MDDLLTGDIQPVRKAPPPPRLPPPGKSQINSHNSWFGDNTQLPAPLPRTQSSKGKSKAPKALQHSVSMPLPLGPTNTNVGNKPKKPPPPRPPPPKMNSKTQRLGSRQHDRLKSGGQSFAPSSSNNIKNSTSDALLIDFSSPPGSPSTAASGSDGLSVNSLGSESGGSLLDAPTSWCSAATNKAFVNTPSFDPFDSIEEDSKTFSSTKVAVGGSSFYSSVGTAASSVQRPAPSNSNLSSLSQNTTSIDWSKAKNNRTEAKDPFSPVRQVNGRASGVQKPSETVWHSDAPSATNQTTKKAFRATIIRPKQPQTSVPSSQAPQDVSALNHSNSYRSELSQATSSSAQQPNIQSAHSSNSMAPSGEKSPVYAVAEFDFESFEPGDLPLKVGDRVELVAAINDDWLEGRLNGKQGLFPTAFVKIEGNHQQKSAASSPPEVPSNLLPGQAVALYSFAAEMPTDLSLAEGDIVSITAVVEGGQWLFGYCHGRSGQFPANFVSQIPPNLPVVTM